MRTLRLPSPFDDPHRQADVSTPTCCCSCCCCCLVTTLTSTTMTAVYVNERALRKGVGPTARAGLGLVGVVGLVLAVGGLLGAATVPFLGSKPADLVIGSLSALISGLVLLMISRGSGSPNRPEDLAWAGSVAALTALAFCVELFSLGFLIYGQLLAIPLPIIAGVLLHRNMVRRR